MNEEKIKDFHSQFALISKYLTYVAIDLDNIVYGDITATDSYTKSIKKEVEEHTYKLNLAVKDLQKMIKKEILQE